MNRQNGFTLVEIAMVLLIVTLLLGGLVPTLSGQIEQRRITETTKQLEEVREALIGYTIINDRLPCPASVAAGSGVEDPLGGGNCTYFSNSTDAGYNLLPAVTLGLSGTNSSGLLEDAWGNPIRYAVTSWTNAFTTFNGMKTAGISNLDSADLTVCSTAAGMGATCAAGTTLTSNAVIVIYSLGRNGASGGTGADEAENLNPNAVDNHDDIFISHTTSATAGNEFDDIVVWVSPNVLVNRMVQAGKLP